MDLLFSLCIAGVVSAASAPYFSNWGKDLCYRESAGKILSVLREGRSRAIYSNLEHWVEVDLKKRRIRMLAGDRAENSSQTSVVADWVELPQEAVLTLNTTCAVPDTVKFNFNPNGTSFSRYICITDTDGKRRLLVGVQNPITSRIVVRKPADNGWQ